jgi:type IV pilus assembly protein PilO
MLDRLPFWGQVVVMLLLSALLVVITYVFVLKEKRAETQALRTRYDEMEGKIREGLAIEQKLPEFEREIAGLQRKLGDIQQILPTGPETGDLLRWIKNLADQSNLDLKSFGPGAMRPVEFYKEFPIEMNVVGRYHDLGIFLDRVAKYQRIINVDNLKIGSNPGGGDKSIRSSFTATTFVYDETQDKSTEGAP